MCGVGEYISMHLVDLYSIFIVVNVITYLLSPLRSSFHMVSVLHVSFLPRLLISSK